MKNYCIAAYLYICIFNIHIHIYKLTVIRSIFITVLAINMSVNNGTITDKLMMVFIIRCNMNYNESQRMILFSFFI